VPVKTRQEILDYLFALHRQGAIKYDLARMYEACRRLGDPQAAYQSVHVAGTNGKGAVCAMVDSVFRRAGRRTGLFIKPHLVDFEERFMFDNRPVSSQAWLDVYAELEPTIADLGLTFFEISTLLAFELFRRARVEWAVFETGMGGRLDATNVVKPAVSVITALSMDHAEWLGTTVEAVAGEKLGIVKPGVPLVMVLPPEANVRSLAGRICADAHAELTYVSGAEARDVVAGNDGSEFTYDGIRCRVPLAGRHQLTNAVTAIETCRMAGVTDPTVIAEGIAKTRLPGRFQAVSVGGKTLVFDIAHNPQAGQALAETLQKRFGQAPICVVTGVMKDKDIAGFLAPLRDVAAAFMFAQPDIPRACPAGGMPGLLGTTALPVKVVPKVADAMREALAGDCDVVCVTGSFYTVGEAMTAVGVKPWPEAGTGWTVRD